MIKGDGTDVVVVGAGVAGLVAANRALELGQTCIVLEKGQDQYPCNSRLTGGLFHVCFKDITGPPDRLFAVISNEVPDVLSFELARAVADNGARLIRWLRLQGVRFMKASPDEAFRWVLAPPRVMRVGVSWKGRGGDVLLRTLEQRLIQRGGILLRDARAKALITRDSVCIGAAATVAGEERVFRARATVIADGGFQANLEMLRKYISLEPASLFQRNAATSNGDGIRMAETVGAKLVGMESIYGHVLSRSVFGNPDLWPYPIMDRVVAAAIVVDGSGSRFVDEGQGGVHQTNGIARLRNPLSAVAVFDDAIWQTAGRAFIFPPNPYLEKRGGVLLRALDLASLARVAGLPVDSLMQTIAAYNDAVGARITTRLNPVRSTDLFTPMPIVKPPFYAVPLCAGITYTMGGIATDGCARVLDREDRPIPGLFAAGCTTGGLEGGMRSGYIGGLAKSASMALLAAETIARASDSIAA
jgi:fumarate reductase flavoprotein subunit